MGRILVIEDNPTNLELMVYLLNAFGYEVLSAVDGESGIESARRNAPDLVICDIGLPKLDGYGVAAYLKGHPALQKTPLLAVTALAMVGDRDKVLAAGFDGYVPKPIEPETFVRQVERFLPSSHPAPQLSVAQSNSARPTYSGARAKILVVDNNPASRYLIQSILEPSGYQVILAARVSEALALARASIPELVITDLHMPDQDGFDLIRAIRAESRFDQASILVLSASAHPEHDRHKALELGANGFLKSPIEPVEFLAEMTELLAKRTK